MRRLVHGDVAPQIIVLLDHRNLAYVVYLLMILLHAAEEVLLGLSRRALDHHELKFVDLICVVCRPLGDYREVFQVPNNDAAVMRSRCHVPIALAYLNVDDHVCVAVQ